LDRPACITPITDTRYMPTAAGVKSSTYAIYLVDL
jgi:hypothetical protein